MVCIDPDSGTLCLNAATVPRVVPLPHSNGEQTRAAPACVLAPQLAPLWLEFCTAFGNALTYDTMPNS